MFDVDTYLTTQNTSGGPIIRQLDRADICDIDLDDDAGTEFSIGAAIGQAIVLLLILGVLLYFHSA
ncbi:hypothetical protein [Sphingobium sp. CFD-2]|uniref:hypothetical protein n=1 Tax=Sphingobium sp. CFD-2 TaxID=2878542 RepID=UPI00214B4FBA|nr:hypothetical protein [Sphingobium sp. CFD-2]